MFIRLDLHTITILLLYHEVESGFGDEDEWGYSSHPSSSFKTTSEVPASYPTSFGTSRYSPSGYNSRPLSFLQFNSQLSNQRPPKYQQQQDNYLYSAGSNPFSSGGLSHALYQSSNFQNPPADFDSSNYHVENVQEPNFSHFSKSPSLSNPVIQDPSDDQLQSSQDIEQALGGLLQQFNNQVQYGGLSDDYQSYSPPPQGQAYPPPEQQFQTQSSGQFSSPPQEQVSTPPDEEFPSPQQDKIPSPPQQQFYPPPQEQPPPPPSPPKPSLTSGPGGETILLSPEQAQILRQVMPELGIKTPDLPITVTPEQLKKLQDVIARTNFRLPAGFPPELVANTQAAAKAPPKRVHKAAAVRSKNKNDDDPEEFIRKLASYKKQHGIDTMLGENTPAQEGMLDMLQVDTSNL